MQENNLFKYIYATFFDFQGIQKFSNNIINIHLICNVWNKKQSSHLSSTKLQRMKYLCKSNNHLFIDVERKQFQIQHCFQKRYLKQPQLEEISKTIASVKMIFSNGSFWKSFLEFQKLPMKFVIWKKRF